jgi:pectate lyase
MTLKFTSPFVDGGDRGHDGTNNGMVEDGVTVRSACDLRTNLTNSSCKYNEHILNMEGKLKRNDENIKKCILDMKE